MAAPPDWGLENMWRVEDRNPGGRLPARERLERPSGAVSPRRPAAANPLWKVPDWGTGNLPTGSPTPAGIPDRWSGRLGSRPAPFGETLESPPDPLANAIRTDETNPGRDHPVATSLLSLDISAIGAAQGRGK